MNRETDQEYFRYFHVRYECFSITVRYVAMWGNEMREQNTKFAVLRFIVAFVAILHNKHEITLK